MLEHSNLRQQHTIFGGVDVQFANPPPEPFIKWVGGKRRQTRIIAQHSPNKINNYYEPFIGGGSVFYALHDKIYGKAYLSDINERLINAYQCVRDNCDEVLLYLSNHADGYMEDEEIYYAMREVIDAGTPAMQAATFIFLNKTCFNGKYSVNKKNQFNCSKGHDAISHDYICNVMQTKRASEALQIAESIECMSYSDLNCDIKAGDFMYLDPPYDETWDKYSSSPMKKDGQIALHRFIKYYSNLGCNIMLSNNATDFIKDLYGEFNQMTITARQNLRTAGKQDMWAQEIIITNY